MVVTEAGEASRLVAAGFDVVLIIRDADPAGPVPAGGRLALLVGDPADPQVRAAAEEMDRELFGSLPTSAPGPLPA